MSVHLPCPLALAQVPQRPPLSPRQHSAAAASAAAQHQGYQWGRQACVTGDSRDSSVIFCRSKQSHHKTAGALQNCPAAAASVTAQLRTCVRAATWQPSSLGISSPVGALAVVCNHHGSVRALVLAHTCELPPTQLGGRCHLGDPHRAHNLHASLGLLGGLRIWTQRGCVAVDESEDNTLVRSQRCRRYPTLHHMHRP